MIEPLNVLVVSPDPWWARMACALAEHAGHRAGTSDDEPGRVLRLVRRERPDVVLMLVDAAGCTELAAALATRRSNGAAIVLATRDVPAWSSRCATPGHAQLGDIEVVDAWAEPTGIVRALERASRARLRVVDPEGPGATAANLRL